MRQVTMVILGVMLVCCFDLPKAAGTILFDDGLTHNIDWYTNEDVDVINDAFSGKATTVNLLPGGLVYSLIVVEDSQVNISGGLVGGGVEEVWRWGQLRAFGNSRVNISGGSIQNTSYAYDNSQVIISGGLMGAGLLTSDNSQVIISGGSMPNSLLTYGNSQIIISGGEILDLFAHDYSQVTVSGGSIENSIWAGRDSWDNNNCTISFVGNNFAINGISIDYGEYNRQDWISGTLTGTLANGDFLNNEFYIYGDSRIVLIPEPATLLLLGLGGIFLQTKRKA